MASLALKCTAGVAAATALLAKRSLSHASRPAAAAAPITSPPRINFAVLSTVRGLREGHDAGLAAMASSRAAAGQPAIPLDLHYTSVDAADVDSVIARADVVLGEPKAVGPLLNAAPRLLWYQSTFAGVEHVFTHSDRSDFLFTRMGAGMNEGI
ncbi:MAG: hypothetical protein P4L40_25405, partial [Terracidiphilus sp.]|nr:hypothetical protein [Terracidiphilus sp.]